MSMGGPKPPGGCGCRLDESPETPDGGAMISTAMALAAWARRRRRARILG
jgi:MYXO-CTERM domain-containing protein